MRALLINPEVRFVEERDYGGSPSGLFELLGLDRYFSWPKDDTAWMEDHLRRVIEHRATGDLLYVGQGGGHGNWEFGPHSADSPRMLRGPGAIVGGWMPGYKMWSSPRMRIEDLRGLITWRNG